MKLRLTLYEFFDTLQSVNKVRILVIADLLVVCLAYYLGMALRLNNLWPIAGIHWSWTLLFLMLASSMLTGRVLSTHAIKLRSYESNSMVRSAMWATAVSLFGFVINIVFELGAPRTVPVIFGLLAFFFAFTMRLTLAEFLNWLGDSKSGRIPVAIYGAGSGGMQLIAALRNSKNYRPVLLVDESKALQRLMISGLRVRPPSVLNTYAHSGRIKEVFLAFPSMRKARKNQIVQELVKFNCKVSELPTYETILRRGGIVHSLRPIEPDDLLDREGVNLNIPELETIYSDANILVSGAGGSIGSELCRKALAIGAQKIVLFEQSEIALYTIERELRQKLENEQNSGIEIVPVLGSVINDDRVHQVLTDHNIEIVLHAAAYKHVPLVESNPCEGVRNNVFGTHCLATAAVECGVRRFIMISTDKAVRPTGIMGASKRLAERVIQNCQMNSKNCVFGIVRFGNVLGSSGSVIPLFREQINDGGPVTLTHSDVTRYFMTLNEAAFLVLLAGSFAENGEVFVLDMGEPVRIEDLAKRMIILSGKTVQDQENPDGDIEIQLTGLRDGEKLYEELLVGDNTLPTPHPKILRAQEKMDRSGGFVKAIESLRTAVNENDTKRVQEIMQQHVENFGAEVSG